MAFCNAPALLPYVKRIRVTTKKSVPLRCCTPPGELRHWIHLSALPVSAFHEFCRNGVVPNVAAKSDNEPSTVAIGVPASATVHDTIAFVRAVAMRPPAPDCLFVLHDASEKVIGYVPLADLLCVREHTKKQLACLARENNYFIRPTDTLMTVASKLTVEGETVAPVVDQNNRLLGIVRAKDVARLAAGAGNAPYFANRIPALIFSRAPWLVALLIVQSTSSAILGQFADLIEHNVLLAFFLTMIVGSAGNSGSQSASILIVGLARGEIDAKCDFWRVMRRELIIASVLGLLLAIVAFLRVIILGGFLQWMSALTIALALLMTVVAASVVASATPMLLKLLKIDPTLASGPALSTLTDICGVVLLCTTAALLLGN